MVVFNNAMAGAAGQSGGAAGYTIDNSLRFNGAQDASHLTRTFGSGGNRSVWTYSTWVKFVDYNLNSGILEAPYVSGNTITECVEIWMSGGGIKVTDQGSYYFVQDSKFKDPTAWGHLMIVLDTSKTDNADRLRFYWNGEIVDGARSTTLSQYADLGINKPGLDHKIGQWRGGNELNGYLAETYFIDGVALPPSAFGQVNEDTGAWDPIEYAYEAPQNSLVPSLAEGALIIKADGATISGSVKATGSVKVYTSSNGINWTYVGSSLNRNVGEAKYLAIGGGGTNSRTFTASDGATYTWAEYAVNNAFDAGGSHTTDVTGLTYSANGTVAATYGTTGFYLPFNNTATGGSVCEDASGNNNNWTPKNISVLGATSVDTDVITGTGTASLGATISSNYSSTGTALSVQTAYWNSFNSNTGWVSHSWAIGVNPGGTWICNYNNATPGTVLTFYWGSSSANTTIVTGGDIWDPQTYNITSALCDTTAPSTTTGSAAETALKVTTRKVGISVTVSKTSGTIEFTCPTGSSAYYLYGHAPFSYTATTLTLSGDTNFDKLAESTLVTQDTVTSGLPAPTTFTYSFSPQNVTNLGPTVPQDRRLFYNQDRRVATLGTYSPANAYIILDAGSSSAAVTIYPKNSSGSLYGSNDLVYWTFVGSINSTDTTSTKTGYRYYCPDSTSAAYGGLTIGSGVENAPADGIVSVINSGTNTLTLSDVYGTFSANTNNYTSSVATAASNADTDTLSDSPTNGAPYVDTGLGGELPGNYATLNPLTQTAPLTFTNGNLEFTCPTTNTRAVCLATLAMTEKTYWEMEVGTGGNTGYTQMGIIPISGFNQSLGNSNIENHDADAVGWYMGSSGQVRKSSTVAYTTTPVLAGGIASLAFDPSTGNLYAWVNGVAQNSGNPVTTVDASKTYIPAFLEVYATQKNYVNFGQRPFAYSVAPAGYKCLCTANMPDPDIKDGSTAMTATVFTGTGSAQVIDTPNHKPDLVWVKSRSNAYSNLLFDRVRGDNQVLKSDQTDIEADFSPDYVGFRNDNAFDILGAATWINANATNSVAWTWNGGTAFSNSAGTNGADIASAGYANQTAGFSIVKWTSIPWTGSAVNRQVGHGLGAAPAFIITKGLDNAAGWYCYHKDLDASNPEDYYLTLNNVNARGNLADSWGPNKPDSTTFGDRLLGWSASQDVIAYCFAPVEGYSHFGTYIGNLSSDGPFEHTGFRPRWILLKSATDGREWTIWDTARDPYNPVGQWLYPHGPTATAEQGSPGGLRLLVTSNGFKITSAAGFINETNQTFIYAAFAETPQKFSRAV